MTKNEPECYSEPLLDCIKTYEGDETWHDGPGWYYVLVDYPDEGSFGAFKTFSELLEHAEKAVER